MLLLVQIYRNVVYIWRLSITPCLWQHITFIRPPAATTNEWYPVLVCYGYFQSQTLIGGASCSSQSAPILYEVGSAGVVT